MSITIKMPLHAVQERVLLHQLASYAGAKGRYSVSFDSGIDGPFDLFTFANETVGHSIAINLIEGKFIKPVKLVVKSNGEGKPKKPQRGKVKL